MNFGSNYKYCRPIDRTTNTVKIYVSNFANSAFQGGTKFANNNAFEAGTMEYPYSNVAFAFMEVFNLREAYKGI